MIRKIWVVLLGILLLGEVVLVGSYARRTFESRDLPAQDVKASSADHADILVSFKLEPGLTQDWLHGKRWVSSYDTVQEGHTFTVEAKAQVLALDANGHLVKASSKWVPLDPDMVTVSSGNADEVRITIQHAGASRLEVISQEEALWLYIRATYLDDNTMRVEIFSLCGGHPVKSDDW